ncbi:hypothetical protein [Pontibacter pamirensis]|uniref:hypothetical protein n=1 Tax=Pontibacter pamirensis TaxID=2562824 RepID=UPI00138A349B|nr:hypothetical protein [Pontibacter pamirensis]
MKKGSLLIPFIVLSIGCANDPNDTQANESPSDTVVQSESLGNVSKAQTSLEEQKYVLGELIYLQQKVESGDYSQVEQFISQVEAYISAQPNQMTAEQRLNFPQLTKKDLIDFLKSIDMDSLKANGSFDKKYSFGSAPKEFKPDNEECPDLLILSVDNNSSEVSLLSRNSFLVDEDIGCAESATIHVFTFENGVLQLKKMDYVG